MLQWNLTAILLPWALQIMRPMLKLSSILCLIMPTWINKYILIFYLQNQRMFWCSSSIFNLDQFLLSHLCIISFMIFENIQNITLFFTTDVPRVCHVLVSCLFSIADMKLVFLVLCVNSKKCMERWLSSLQE